MRTFSMLLLVGLPFLPAFVAPRAAADQPFYQPFPRSPTALSGDPVGWTTVFENGPLVVEGSAPSPEPHDGSPFVRGGFTVELGVGAYGAPVGIGPHIPTFEYLPVNLRLGCMVTTACGSGCLRGNLEALLELMAAPVTTGFGDVLGGPSLLLRYNFVQPHCRVVPYLQIGGGLLFTDAHEDPTQKAIGQSFEFLLQAGVGCRCFLNDHCSVNAEAGYQHISNAGLADRNLGVNALGGMLSFTYYLPGGR
ncbi:MAG TPA: acyloxyacyl hydrolase [Gemmataceae bacterium]|nr:acyloxyacyl hydrolase [Gemmataceae bacterium]